MKVKVISSRYSHIDVGMEGEAYGITLPTFEQMNPEAQIIVSFSDVSNPVPGYIQRSNITVSMLRKELQKL